MDNSNKKTQIPPLLQAAILGGSALVGMLGAALIAKEALTIWMIGTSCLLLYAMINNGMSMFAEDYKKYLIHSIYSFMLIMITVIATATLLSGLSVSEAGGYRMILMIILMANFTFIAMIVTVKSVLAYIAETDEKL